jgi:hypothetical protein
VDRAASPYTLDITGKDIASRDGRTSASGSDCSAIRCRHISGISYTTKDAWTFALNTESTYDWDADAWSVPINFTVSKLIKIEEQPISLQAGVRYWAAAPDNGPEGLGFRVALTFLFPK